MSLVPNYLHLCKVVNKKNLLREIVSKVGTDSNGSSYPYTLQCGTYVKGVEWCLYNTDTKDILFDQYQSMRYWTRMRASIA